MKNTTFTNLSRDVKGRFKVAASSGGYQLDSNCNPLKLTARQFNTFVRNSIKRKRQQGLKNFKSEVVIHLNDNNEWVYSHCVI